MAGYRSGPSILAAVAALSVCAGTGALGGEEPVGLELVIAADVSSSVDPTEYRLQMQGIAAAFRDPAVIAAIEATPGGIAVAVIQWSGPLQQQHYLRWMRLAGADEAERLAGRVDLRSRGFVGGSTAIAEAIDASVRSLARNRFAGARQVIDISGDGAANQGRSVRDATGRAVALGITVNGLAIANEQPDLGGYYRDEVIGGPGAFVIAVDRFEDFAGAMRRKLLREILGLPVAWGPVSPAR
jgi:hypothetical protein